MPISRALEVYLVMVDRSEILTTASLLLLIGVDINKKACAPPPKSDRIMLCG